MTQDFHSDWRTIWFARKPHQCTWCGEAIPKGTTYEKAAAVFEGDFSALKMHPECRLAVEAWSAAAESGDTYETGQMRRGCPVDDPRSDDDICEGCTCGRAEEDEDE